MHGHSQFSLLEAASRIDELVTIAKTAGMPALALTDSGNLYGAVAFYSACKAAGINPIIGCELALLDGDITDKTTRKPAPNVVLLCKNQTGYQNLTQLVTVAQTEGFYYRPRINWELLEKHREGLMVLTDCVPGILGYHLLRGQRDEAKTKLERLKTLFGDDLYVELQDHGLGPEMQVTTEAVRLAAEVGVDCVITNDHRFSYAGQEQVVDILLCMQQGKTLNDPGRTKTYGPEYYLKNGDELAQRFLHLDRKLVDQALDNTVLVAQKCQFDWPMGESILPAFPLPPEKQAVGMSEADYLKEVVETYACKRYNAVTPAELPAEVTDRLAFELNTLNAMGFAAYFLIVWDFMDYARRQGIPVGPGRGSAAGSLVAYVLGITNIDPIEHTLLFERFLNPERVSMPDIDIDFCIERRGEVIEYVSQRYGKERVCQIATFGTLAAKAAVKAVARVLDIPYAESDRVAKMIPGTPGTKLKDALADGMELAKEVAANPDTKAWVDLALSLEGTACNVGTHAAGVVISKDPLNQVVALQHSKDGQMISQATMGDLEKLGLLKMDFLGLRNLTIIHNALQLIEQTEGAQRVPDMDHLPLEDTAVYELLSAGDTDGVFQLESSGMKALVRDLKPSQFEDINALVALYRPGPLNSGMARDFVDRKHGRQAVSYPHPSLETLLKPTYGTIVYQEQIMQIAQVLSGYSLGQADLLRRAMGKKKAEVMAKEREGFVAGAVANQVDETLANELFDVMSEFAAYCFNRSHSAAYAYVAFQTAYLKAHFPVAYFSALLSSVRDNLDKIQHYIVTARRMGIAVLPPDVTTSGLDFAPDGGNIRFGLASIKNVGVGVVENILQARKEAPFESLEDFIRRVDPKILNRKTLESLIQAGALDSFGYKRKVLFENLETLVRFAEKHREQQETGQVSLFAAMAASVDEPAMDGLMLSGNLNEEYPEADIQALEKALLGFYVSSHPLDGYLERLPVLTTHSIGQLTELAQEGALPDESLVLIGGLVTSLSQRLSKKNKPLLIGSLEDFTAPTEFIAFGESIEPLAAVLKEGARVLLSAKVSFRGGGGDEGEETRFSLIAQQAVLLDEITPLELNLSQPPSYEAWIYAAKVLSQNRPQPPENNGRKSWPGKENGSRTNANGSSSGFLTNAAVGVPVVFRLSGLPPFKTAPQFWVDARQAQTVKAQLQQSLALT